MPSSATTRATRNATRTTTTTTMATGTSAKGPGNTAATFPTACHTCCCSGRA